MRGDRRNICRQAVIWFILPLFILFMAPFRAGAEVTVTPGTVRVGLAQDVGWQDFHVRGKYRLIGLNGEIVARVLPGERWQVKSAGSGLQVLKNGQQVGTYGSPLVLKQESQAAAVLGGKGDLRNLQLDRGLSVVGAGGQVTTLRVGTGGLALVSAAGPKTIEGSGDQPLVGISSGGRTCNYRGNMEFRAQGKGVTVINELPIEEYLYGVVPREMYVSWPLEALKAQAVSARTYAIAQMGTYRTYGFDILANEKSQVYGGFDAEHGNSTRAVNETRGQVLIYRGKPISAFFHSSSGGYIEYCQDVWRAALDYLTAKPDPYDRNDRYYNWEESFTQDRLVNQLKDKKSLYNKPGDPERVFSRVDDVAVMEKTTSGARVKKIRITGSDQAGKALTVELSNADTVRSALGLKSALFEIVKKEKDTKGKIVLLAIRGSGNGHGLGMSQYGALGMANKGYNYQDILKYYYKNVEIRPFG